MALGRPNVDQMLSEMTSAQFAEWMAYSRLEPWGEERDDLRTGIVASTMANINRGKSRKPYKPTDFMPSFEPISEEELAARMLANARSALGGRR